MTQTDTSFLALRKRQASAQFEELIRHWYADQESRVKAQDVEDAYARWKRQLDHLEPGCAYRLKVEAQKKVRAELGLC